MIDSQTPAHEADEMFSLSLALPSDSGRKPKPKPKPKRPGHEDRFAFA